jgi:hypothetical protein
MREWLPHFATRGCKIALEDLVLFGDCYYLPHEEGVEAEELYRFAQDALGSRASAVDPASVLHQHAERLRQFCACVTILENRSLFYALSRRAWELREELDLIEKFVRFKSEKKTGPFHSDSHLPGTYRGGMVARLQRLLNQQPDGAFAPVEQSQSTQ